MNQRSCLRTEKRFYGWLLAFFYCSASMGCTTDIIQPSVEELKVYEQRLIFSSNRDGNWEIYMMNADGSNPVNLTHHPADDRGPRWSPDGERIAFVSNRDGNEEIYVMNIDGNELKSLNHNPEADEQPFWSPEGRRLVFVSRQGLQRDIFVINTNG